MSSSLHRFFVDPASLDGERVTIGGPRAHQISRVLRLRPGDRVVLVDGAGAEYVARLVEARPAAVVAVVESRRASRPEPSVALTLYQALVPRDRFELVLQKGTEVGMARFVPVWCERSIVPGGERVDERRLERWRRIVTEAAEQCERGAVPEVTAPVRFVGAVAAALADGPLLIAWEREQERSARDGLRAALASLHAAPTVPGSGTADGRSARPPLGLMVGPEGGFSSTEIEYARGAGAIAVSLGPRILRTETAGPVLAALALYEAGDLAPPPSPHAGERERRGADAP